MRRMESNIFFARVCLVSFVIYLLNNIILNTFESLQLFDLLEVIWILIDEASCSSDEEALPYILLVR